MFLKTVELVLEAVALLRHAPGSFVATRSFGRIESSIFMAGTAAIRWHNCYQHAYAGPRVPTIEELRVHSCHRCIVETYQLLINVNVNMLRLEGNLYFNCD